MVLLLLVENFEREVSREGEKLIRDRSGLSVDLFAGESLQFKIEILYPFQRARRHESQGSLQVSAASSRE